MAARVRWSNKLFICLALIALGGTLCQAAEYKNGQLWLEINLASSPVIQLKTTGVISISDTDKLINRQLTGKITLSQATPYAVNYYGILGTKTSEETGVEDTLSLRSDYFAWEAGKLQIRSEFLHFLPVSFSSRSEAETYAAQNRIPLSKIMEIPLINSTVKVENESGEAVYLETPLKIISDQALYINGNNLGFEGEFVVKTVKQNMVLNQYLALEDYLAGVVQNEIGDSSPFEALKAQAVAARTHALALLVNNRHKADGYDLCNSTHCQVYKGKYLQTELILKAIKDCQDEALFFEGYIADATYHSCCGGKTDSSAAIWKGKPFAYLSGVTCIPEVDSLDLTSEKNARKWINKKVDMAGMSSWEKASLNWEKTINLKQVALNAGMDSISTILITQRGQSGRITALKLIGDKTVSLDSEYKIRQVFGNLPSSFFYLKGSYRQKQGQIAITPKANMQIKGKGSGHGVGMCQVGALRLAREGMSYEDILSHYYPGTTLSSEWKNGN